MPKVTLNDDGTISKVEWSYRLGSTSSAALDSQTVIKRIELQISGEGQPAANYPQEGRLYNSGEFFPTVTSHVLTYRKTQWSNVSTVSLVYDDFYGNHYVIIWTPDRP